MSRYNRYQRPKARPWKIHPVWRGIGFIWLILMPILSYGAAWTLTRQNFKNHWLPMTADMIKPIQLPVINWSFLSFPIDFNILIRWIPGQPLYNVDFLFFLGFLIIGFGFMSVMYAFLYRTMAPGRSPFDAPEVESQRPRKRR